MNDIGDKNGCAVIVSCGLDKGFVHGLFLPSPAEG